MFNRLANTYQKFRSKADEVRQTVAQQVTQQASRAREILGLQVRQQLTAPELASYLENEAAAAVSSLAIVVETLERWTSQIAYSELPNAPVYPDVIAEEGDFEFIPEDRPLLDEMQQRKESTLEEEEEKDGSSGMDAADESRQEVEEAEERQNSQVVHAAKSPEMSPTHASSTASLQGLPPAPQPVRLTFKQVFLRSRALQIFLASLPRNKAAREAFFGPPEEWEEGTSSPRALLQRLLNQTLRGDTKLHWELAALLCTTDATPCPQLPAVAPPRPLAATHAPSPPPPRESEESNGTAKEGDVAQQQVAAPSLTSSTIPSSPRSSSTAPAAAPPPPPVSSMVQLPPIPSPCVSLLAELVNVLKVDWREDQLVDERRRLAREIERLAQSLQKVALEADGSSPSPPEGSTDEDLEKLAEGTKLRNWKVLYSKEQLEKYIATEANLRECAEVRKSAAQKLDVSLKHLLGSFDAVSEHLKSQAAAAADRSDALREKAATDTAELTRLAREREEDARLLESKVVELDAERERLRQRLEELDGVAADLKGRLRYSQIAADRMHGELGELQKTYRGESSNVSEIKRNAETKQTDINNMRTVAMQAETNLKDTLTFQSHDAMEKAETIRRTRRHLAVRHLEIQKSLLQYLNHVLVSHAKALEEIRQRREELLGKIPAESDNADGTPKSPVSVMTVEEQLTRAENSRRHHFARAASQIDALWTAAEALCKREMSDTRMGGDDEDKVNGDEKKAKAAATSTADGNETKQREDKESIFKEEEEVSLRIGQLYDELRELYESTKKLVVPILK